MRKISTKMVILALSSVTLFLIAKAIGKIVISYAPDFSLLWFSTASLQTSNPYLNPHLFTINAYPPLTFFLYTPLIYIPYSSAQIIFTLASFACLIGCVLISIKISLKTIPWHIFLLYLSLALLSFPVRFTIGMGQVNLISLFFLLVSFSLLLSKKRLLSGIFLGLSIVLKPIFSFFLIIFINQKAWKSLFSGTLTIFLCSLGSIILGGITPWAYWFTDILPELGNLMGREVYYNQGFLGFISRFIENLDLRKILYILISFTLVAIYQISAKNSNKIKLQFSLLIITLVLIDPLSLQHHFAWLIFPLIVFANLIFNKKKILPKIFLVSSYLLISGNIKSPFLYTQFPNLLLLSNNFYGVFLLWLLSIYLLKNDLHLNFNGDSSRKIKIRQ